MGTNTAITWTDATWNPIRGCSRVSEGCRNCYAESVAARFSGPGQPYEGLAKRGPARWTGVVRLVPEHLDDPLRWTKPRRIFVNSMSDLFHEKLSNEDIASVFAVMGLAQRHTFQVLTKRPERMRYVMRWLARSVEPLEFAARAIGYTFKFKPEGGGRPLALLPWPLPNVHLGVSCEDQATASERIPLLLATPAAVRWVSVEPQLGPVTLSAWLYRANGLRLDWVVVGGESGPHARRFDPDWARIILAECRAAGVPVFVKQMGEVWARFFGAKSRHGADPVEWPADLRVQEFPR